MNNTRFRECLDLLGLSQVAAARLFRIGDRSVRRYASDEQIPTPIAMALEMMVHLNIKPGLAFQWATGEEFEG